MMMMLLLPKFLSISFGSKSILSVPCGKDCDSRFLAVDVAEVVLGTTVVVLPLFEVHMEDLFSFYCWRRI